MTPNTYLDIIKAINPWVRYIYIGGRLKFLKGTGEFGTEFDIIFLAPIYL